MIQKRALLKFLSLLFVALFMSNCADKPTHLELTIRSGASLNPDRAHISSPLMLNFYELKDAEQFSKLDFWALVDEPAKRLEGDLVSQSKHVIVPNEEQTYKILFNQDSRFLGIIGSFRNIDDNATWRYVKNLDLRRYNDAELYIDNYAIREVE
jgi:type VI secretion system protein VasD